MDWAGLARPCTTTSPDAPAPVDATVMVPPEVRVTVFAFTVIVPPVADGAVPEVAAERVPPFWTVSDCVETFIFPPAPVPCVLVKSPLPLPSMSTEAAGPLGP